MVVVPLVSCYMVVAVSLMSLRLLQSVVVRRLLVFFVDVSLVSLRLLRLVVVRGLLVFLASFSFSSCLDRAPEVPVLSWADVDRRPGALPV